ncbi:hypothetical protein FW778_14770 [Ginsengibacter hankyongi]|uniref:Uncharacterized protein n=1 Tax=Ginsengibacter hankyongi TaxID=2607284 RepID=A0A5J5IFG5_9BACT|nr:hypothetical protein [Ginsengibacter hankyongi]KAA9038025.1 hypothetical protein FW778_14770 [Ginsengibacter hankyongi]
MKKSIVLFICMAFLFACNQSSDKVEANEQHSHDQAQTTELSLNNGAKWKADSITNINVLNLRTIADNFRIISSPSANDYQILSSDLNNALNKMIQQCKMTGPDHEALHHWLEPVLKETNELKNITDTASARTTFKSIDKRLDDYHNYFE